MTTKETLAKIIPGKTYPSDITITETIEGKPMVVKFCMNSFIVGMYCCIYVNGEVACQSGDNNNKSVVTRLKKDVKKAISRGASVEFGDIREIKKDC